MLIRLLVVVSMVTLGACVHQVYRLEADDQKVADIQSELENECRPDQCSLGRCWSETQDLTVCKVDLSFFSGGAKQELLERVRQNLSKRGIEVGFCGHDSTGTQFAGGMACALVVGMLSGASGGHGGAAGACGHDRVEVVGPEATIDNACSTEPSDY